MSYVVFAYLASFCIGLVPVPRRVRCKVPLDRSAVVKRMEHHLIEVQGELSDVMTDAAARAVITVEGALSDGGAVLEGLENEAALQIARSAVDEEAVVLDELADHPRRRGARHLAALLVETARSLPHVG